MSNYAEQLENGVVNNKSHRGALKTLYLVTGKIVGPHPRIEEDLDKLKEVLEKCLIRASNGMSTGIRKLLFEEKENLLPGNPETEWGVWISAALYVVNKKLERQKQKEQQVA